MARYYERWLPGQRLTEAEEILTSVVSHLEREGMPGVAEARESYVRWLDRITARAAQCRALATGESVDDTITAILASDRP